MPSLNYYFKSFSFPEEVLEKLLHNPLFEKQDSWVIKNRAYFNQKQRDELIEDGNFVGALCLPGIPQSIVLANADNPDCAAALILGNYQLGRKELKAFVQELEGYWFSEEFKYADFWINLFKQEKLGSMGNLIFQFVIGFDQKVFFPLIPKLGCEKEFEQFAMNYVKKRWLQHILFGRSYGRSR